MVRPCRTPAQAAGTLADDRSDSSELQYRSRPGTESGFPGGTFVTNSGGGIDRNMRYAYSEQASLQIDEQFGKGLVVSAGYLIPARA